MHRTRKIYVLGLIGILISSGAHAAGMSALRTAARATRTASARSPLALLQRALPTSSAPAGRPAFSASQTSVTPAPSSVPLIPSPSIPTALSLHTAVRATNHQQHDDHRQRDKQEQEDNKQKHKRSSHDAFSTAALWCLGSANTLQTENDDTHNTPDTSAQYGLTDQQKAELDVHIDTFLAKILTMSAEDFDKLQMHSVRNPYSYKGEPVEQGYVLSRVIDKLCANSLWSAINVSLAERICLLLKCLQYTPDAYSTSCIDAMSQHFTQEPIILKADATLMRSVITLFDEKTASFFERMGNLLATNGLLCELKEGVLQQITSKAANSSNAQLKKVFFEPLCHALTTSPALLHKLVPQAFVSIYLNSKLCDASSSLRDTACTSEVVAENPDLITAWLTALNDIKNIAHKLVTPDDMFSVCTKLFSMDALAGSHTDQVNGVAFSPDGTTLVSDTIIKLWGRDAKDGMMTAKIFEQASGLLSTLYQAYPAERSRVLSLLHTLQNDTVRVRFLASLDRRFSFYESYGDEKFGLCNQPLSSQDLKDLCHMIDCPAVPHHDATEQLMHLMIDLVANLPSAERKDIMEHIYTYMTRIAPHKGGARKWLNEPTRNSNYIDTYTDTKEALHCYILSTSRDPQAVGSQSDQEFFATLYDACINVNYHSTDTYELASIVNSHLTQPTMFNNDHAKTLEFFLDKLYNGQEASFANNETHFVEFCQTLLSLPTFILEDPFESASGIVKWRLQQNLPFMTPPARSRIFDSLFTYFEHTNDQRKPPAYYSGIFSEELFYAYMLSTVANRESDSKQAQKELFQQVYDAVYTAPLQPPQDGASSSLPTLLRLRHHSASTRAIITNLLMQPVMLDKKYSATLLFYLDKLTSRLDSTDFSGAQNDFMRLSNHLLSVDTLGKIESNTAGSLLKLIVSTLPFMTPEHRTELLDIIYDRAQQGTPLADRGAFKNAIAWSKKLQACYVLSTMLYEEQSPQETCTARELFNDIYRLLGGANSPEDTTQLFTRLQSLLIRPVWVTQNQADTWIDILEFLCSYETELTNTHKAQLLRNILASDILVALPQNAVSKLASLLRQHGPQFTPSELADLLHIAHGNRSASEAHLLAHARNKPLMLYYYVMAERLYPGLLTYVREQEAQGKIVGFHGDHHDQHFLRDLFKRLYEVVVQEQQPSHFLRFDRTIPLDELTQQATAIASSNEPHKYRPSLFFFVMSLFGAKSGSSAMEYALANSDQTMKQRKDLTEIRNIFKALGIESLMADETTTKLLQAAQEKYGNACGDYGVLVATAMTPEFAAQFAYRADYGGKLADDIRAPELRIQGRTVGTIPEVARAMREHPEAVPAEEENCLIIPAADDIRHQRSGACVHTTFVPHADKNRAAWQEYEQARDALIAHIQQRLLEHQ